jgi:hypothetical protein
LTSKPFDLATSDDFLTDAYESSLSSSVNLRSDSLFWKIEGYQMASKFGKKIGNDLKISPVMEKAIKNLENP